MNEIVKRISYDMSLREPQSEALSYLHQICEPVEFRTATKSDTERLDIKAKAEESASEHNEDKKNIKVADEFSFPSFCFQMATGIGKTRLMGAAIYYLYKTKGYRHFFILAPGETIYEKLKKETVAGHPKYLFRGLEAEMGRPKVFNGDDYLYYNDTQMQLDDMKSSEIQLFIFNIGKIFTRGDVTFKFHRFQETLGKSFADILNSFNDLVICMDEAHRYYAPASMKAIDYLKPILGLEFTATPKSDNNVIYSYDLAKGAGKFLKIPVMNGRTNMSGYSDSDVQEMKLTDGLLLHENRKKAILKYSAENNLPYVKPIVLIACKDTEHAKDVRTLIDSDSFFKGDYKGKVIEIHSGSGTTEAEENISKLLTIESSANTTEIVLHVYKLKEGWDVNNLFTIIPLNAAKSEILAMQTIGRGLRLPYGKITGEDDIDTLDIVAHDHYREIVEELKANTFFRARDLDKNKIEPTIPVTITPSFDDIQLSLITAFVENKSISKAQDISDPIVQEKIYEAYLKTISAQDKKSAAETPDNQLMLYEPAADEQDKNSITVKSEPQKSGNVMNKQTFIEKLNRIAVTCISTPMIQVHLSTNIELKPIDVVCSYKNGFVIEPSHVERYDVVNNQLLESLDATILEDPNPVNTIACLLLDNISELDSDDADYILGIVNQYLKQIGGTEEHKRQIVRKYATLILEDIRKQVLSAIKTDTQLIYKVQKAFITFGKQIKVIKPDGEVSLHTQISDKSNIRKYIFTGYKKSYYEKYGFDSDAERKFSVILEQDKNVIRWIKPPLNQMGIYYAAGQQYTPDFLVETETEKYMVEIKARIDVKNDDVLLKKEEGELWCKYASIVDEDKKNWHYRLIADDRINIGDSLLSILGLAEDIVNTEDVE
ncbi:MAG: DEAD/DEAH box helicase family protein [Treponema sp.]|nr:DEAD/DEAH box helicase family protein [Treponema sp.]